MGSGKAEIALENSIKFFGASLNVLDHQEAVDLKRSYVQALTLGKVAGLLSSKRFGLAGLDIMEIDIHRVGVELEDGLKDQTENFIQKFIASLADNLPSPSSEMWT